MIDISSYYKELETLLFKPIVVILPEMVYDYIIAVINNHARTTQMIVKIHQEKSESKDEEYLDRLKELKEAVMQVRANISLTKQSLNAIIRTEKFQNTIPPEENRDLEESDLAWQGNKSQLTEGDETNGNTEIGEIIFKDE